MQRRQLPDPADPWTIAFQACLSYDGEYTCHNYFRYNFEMCICFVGGMCLLVLASMFMATLTIQYQLTAQQCWLSVQSIT